MTSPALAARAIGVLLFERTMGSTILASRHDIGDWAAIERAASGIQPTFAVHLVAAQEVRAV